MALSDQEIEEAILTGTYEVYTKDPNETSVNKVRKHVEEKLSLDDGFLSNSEWKSKSKELIKERAAKLLEGWVPEPKDESKAEIGVKRRSTSAEVPERKRQKRGPQAKKAAQKSESPVDESSELTELSEEEEKPKPKKGKARGRPKAKAVDSEGAESEEDKNEAASEEEQASDDEELPTINAVEDSKNGDEDPEKGEESKPLVDEEEEYSDVIDEPVKPKRKKKEKKEKKEVKAKPAKSSKAATKATSTGDDPDEAEIKKLQSHLVKCGIRKLWHNELKKYGDDARAKIKHLKKMLAEVGMDGRFSEAKAREIKERRELMAEAEAAQEMNELWGMEARGRASRSKSKNMKEESDGSAVEDNEDEEEEQAFAVRRRRAQADLAFLGDDSDSD